MADTDVVQSRMVVPYHFVASIPWDSDVSFDDGCHGTDTLWNPLPAQLIFDLKDSGFVEIRAEAGIYVLDAANNLWSEGYDSDLGRLVLEKPENIPQVWTRGFDVHNVDRNLYACYEDSSELNADLTETQRVVVDRFFKAVENMFPTEFAGE